jgi:pilus assembly protein Flp/PilA
MNAGLRTSLPLPRWQALPRLRADESGATAVEYGLIAALVVLAILGGLKALGADLAGLPLQAIIDAI